MNTPDFSAEQELFSFRNSKPRANTIQVSHSGTHAATSYVVDSLHINNSERNGSPLSVSRMKQYLAEKEQAQS
jgi:hypothetical protein